MEIWLKCNFQFNVDDRFCVTLYDVSSSAWDFFENSPVNVHGLDEVARLDRDPAGLPLEGLVVRHSGVDADKDLFSLAAPLSFLPALGGLPMPLGYGTIHI